MTISNKIKTFDKDAISRQKKGDAIIYTIPKGAGTYHNLEQRIIICKAKDLLEHI